MQDGHRRYRRKKELTRSDLQALSNWLSTLRRGLRDVCFLRRTTSSENNNDMMKQITGTTESQGTIKFKASRPFRDRGFAEIAINRARGSLMTITNRLSARFIDRKRTLAINSTPTRYLTPRTVNCVRMHITGVEMPLTRVARSREATVFSRRAIISRFKNQPPIDVKVQPHGNNSGNRIENKSEYSSRISVFSQYSCLDLTNLTHSCFGDDQTATLSNF